MINASTFSFFGKEICTWRTNVCIMFSVYDQSNIRIVCKVGVVMYRFYRKIVTGGSVMMALVCAGLSADCVLPFAVGSMVYAEEFEVVPDEGSTEDPGISVVADSGDTAAVSEDVFAIDGLIEVVEEHSDSSGGSGKEKGSGKDKKTKKLIVGFKDKGCIASIHFEMGQKPSLEQLTAQFPTQLKVYFQEEKDSETVSVSWNSYDDDYSSTDRNYYFFTPSVDQDKYAMQELNLQTDMPYIEVIKDAVSFEMIESAPPKVNEKEVLRYCTQVLRFNKAAVCGVLANVYCESGFRTNAIGDGGTSVGICQWHNSRWTRLREFTPDEWQTLPGQLHFMRKELFTGYRDTLKYLHSVSDDAQGAYDAAYYWCMHYEMPDKTMSRSITRGYLAKNVYWERYKDVDLKTVFTDEDETGGDS